MSLIIRGCNIIKMTDEKDIIKDGYIIVDNGMISKIGEGDPLIEEDDYVIEGKNTVALPGFINTHTHCSMTLLRGYGEGLPLMRWLNERIWPFEAKLTPDDIYKGALLSALEMIKSGTTCFLDMYFHEDYVAKAASEAGIKAVLGSPIIGDGWHKQIDDFIVFYNKYNDSYQGRIIAAIAPHAPYTLSLDALKSVADVALDLNCCVHIHIAETEDEYLNIKKTYNMTPVEFIESTGIFDCSSVVAAHCVYVDGNDIDILKKHNVNVAHCPQSNMKLASGISPVCSMIKRGINVSLGTDGASSNNNLDMIEEMQTASYLQKLYNKDATALSAFTCLEMATKNGAKALKLDKEIGILSEGMKADIVLIDINKPHMVPVYDVYSNIVYSASGRDVKTVLADGKILMENYGLKTLDEEKIMYEAQKTVKDILNR